MDLWNLKKKIQMQDKNWKVWISLQQQNAKSAVLFSHTFLKRAATNQQIIIS